MLTDLDDLDELMLAINVSKILVAPWGRLQEIENATKRFKVIARFSCTLRKQICDSGRQKVVLFLGDVATLGLLHAHVHT